jgi:CRISPR system Cascade subunit CasB
MIDSEQQSGVSAALKRADNSSTEYLSWEYICPWCKDFKNPYERTPYLVVAAAVSRRKPDKDGVLGMGKALACCYPDGVKSDPAKSRLRRLLACSNGLEACEIIRPVLSLLASKGVSVCYASVLNDLLYFGERVKIQWATDFFGRQEGSDDRDDVPDQQS